MLDTDGEHPPAHNTPCAPTLLLARIMRLSYGASCHTVPQLLRCVLAELTQLARAVHARLLDHITERATDRRGRFGGGLMETVRLRRTPGMLKGPGVVLDGQLGDSRFPEQRLDR